MIQQGKYVGDFGHKLERSNDLVNQIVDIVQSPNIFIRKENDENPHTNSMGDKIRFLDIYGYDYDKNRHFFIEAKDFATCVFYNATGLPKRYVDRKLLGFGAPNVYVVFINNEDVYKERKQHNKITKFVDETDDGLVFHPYGERLDILMENRHEYAELKVGSKFKGTNEPQYMWKTEEMKKLSDIFLRDFK